MTLEAREERPEKREKIVRFNDVGTSPHRRHRSPNVCVDIGKMSSAQISPKLLSGLPCALLVSWFSERRNG